MKTSDGKLSLSSENLSDSERFRPDGSHDVTPARALGIPRIPETSSYGSEQEGIHLTARIVNDSLSSRQVSLLLEVLLFQIVNYGCNLAMLLTMGTLYSKLLGNKRMASEINDSKIRTVCTVSEILHNFLGHLEFSGDQNEMFMLSSEQRNILSPYIMNKRTYKSRFTHWRPEKYVKIRAVPVRIQFLERTPNGSQRYSGYTKGYGESHGNAHKKKTKFNSELDGDEKAVDSEERNLKHRILDPDHQRPNQLWIKFKNWLEEKR